MWWEDYPPGVGAIREGSMEEVGLDLVVEGCRGLRANERKEDSLFEIIMVMPASNSLKAATSVAACPSPSCHGTLVLESQDENHVPRLTKKDERETACITADLQQTRICPHGSKSRVQCMVFWRRRDGSVVLTRNFRSACKPL